jgi:hypothetical protein
VGWVLAWPVYVTQQLLPAQKHLPIRLQSLCRLLMF